MNAIFGLLFVLCSVIPDAQTTIEQETVTCPSFAAEQSGYCFFLGRADNQFWDASVVCKTYGCSLFYPLDAAHKTAMTTYMAAQGTSTGYYVGITDYLEKGRYVDVMTGTEVPSGDLEWSSGPSGSTNQNCAYVTGTPVRLVDTSCGDRKKFLCDCTPTYTVMEKR